jgi:hypothetical protein
MISIQRILSEIASLSTKWVARNTAPAVGAGVTEFLGF